VGLSSEFWVPFDSVALQLEVWRAADTDLVPDIVGIQNKVICSMFMNWNNLFSECSEHV